MLHNIPIRATIIWLLLLILTGISLEAMPIFDWVSTAQIGSTALIISFFKSRLILLEYMEIRSAPLAMRLIAEAWCIFMCLILLILYLMLL